MQVDPKKVPEGADVEGNMERLVAASTAFLDVVVNSIENAPKYVLHQQTVVATAAVSEV